MKRNMKKAVVLGLAVVTVMAMAVGCGKKKDYDLYIYNSKGENAESFDRMAAAYTKETGVKLKVFSIGSGTDHMETLRAQMNSDEKPGVFTIQTLSELQEWEESGVAMDFSKATEDSFKDLANNVPEGLRLTTDGTNSYGVPYNVEGYGYIVDKQMVSDLFGEANVDAFLEAFRTATYEEFEAFVLAADDFINNDVAGTVTLSGATFTFQAKAGLAANLTGVFATSGAEKWTYGDHFINVAINQVFANAAAAKAADDAAIDSLKGAFLNYAQALDLKTGHAAGMDGALPRGNEFINSTTANYDSGVQIFSNSKAILYKQGNWVYGSIAGVNADVAARITFLPVKMPIAAEDIKVEGATVEQLNSNIPVFVPMYYAINTKVSKDEQKEAQKFLVWLNTSEEGKKFVTGADEFAFIPYNADPATTTVDNSLGNSIMQYIALGNTLSNPYAGAPSNYAGDTVGLEVMEKYLIKAEWTDADYEAIAQYAIDKWKEMK